MGHLLINNHASKQPGNLVNQAIYYSQLIWIAGGIEGTLDNLAIDVDYEVDVDDMPIDMVLNIDDNDDDDEQYQSCCSLVDNVTNKLN